MKTLLAIVATLVTFAVNAQSTAPKPGTEALEGLETVHGMLANGRGSRVQTILTRPTGTSGKLPAVMLVQWLSCDGIELRTGPVDGMNELSRRIATRAGVVMLRVEKPGLGTSEGPRCEELDFQTELAGYRAGLAMLREHPWVDPDRIALVGMSNGGGILPLVSGDKPVAAYVAVNGWSGTWYEHMLHHLRRNDELRGVPPGQVSARMRGNAELYTDYLIGKKKPSEVIAAKPHLAKLWDDEPAHQYGRPAAFFHQLQELNLAEGWSKIGSPTLAVWGEYEWIMSREDHERIVKMVNANKPGVARLQVVPAMTHFLTAHPTMEKALNDPRSARFPEEAWTSVHAFLREALQLK